METFEFLGLNVIIVAVVVLLVILYLVFLINKRRKDKFLHDGSDRDSFRGG